MAVVTLLKIYADFLGSLHLEAIHCLAGLGDIDLVVVLHNTLSFVVFPESPVPFPWKTTFLSASIALPEREEKNMFLFGKSHRFWKQNTGGLTSFFSPGKPLYNLPRNSYNNV